MFSKNDTRPIRLIAKSVFISLLATPLFANEAGWKEESKARIEQFRKADFAIKLVDGEGAPLKNTAVHLKLTRHDFNFGTAVAAWRIRSKDEDGQKYRDYVLRNFNGIVAENAMKWPQSHPQPDLYVFTDADAILDFAKENELYLRGHNIFWSKKKWQSDWVQALEKDPETLGKAVEERIATIVPRYADYIRDWDMNNEMRHGRFFADALGDDVRIRMFQQAQALHPTGRFYTNEYAVLDNDQDTQEYIDLIEQLIAAGAPVGGIGIQEHAAERFAGVRGEGDEVERGGPRPLIPTEVWQRLDKLAELGLPIQITEVSFKTEDPEAQAEALEAFYRTSFAHPGVDAFYLWGFWEHSHWLGDKASLVNADWSLKPAAKVMEKLLHEEWVTEVEGKTDARGIFHFRGFYGNYNLLVKGDGSEVKSLRIKLPKKEYTKKVTVRSN